MKKKITKTKISLSINPELHKKLEHVSNKSKYIEWLIYQDLLKTNIEGIDEVMI